LERLTRDHSAEALDGPEGREPVNANAITRAVGVQPTLALDMLRDTVCAGDRFLLCSDGLTRTVSEPEIEALMEGGDIGAAVQGLISATLAAGAPDNVVLIAEAYATRCAHCEAVWRTLASGRYTEHARWLRARGPSLGTVQFRVLLSALTFVGNR
jgi:hypothetical protein